MKTHLSPKMCLFSNLFWRYGTCTVQDRGSHYYPIARKNRITGFIQVYLTESNCGLDDPYEWYYIEAGYYPTEFNNI